VKQVILISAFVILLLSIFACGQRDSSKILSQYKFEEDTTFVKVLNKNNLNTWLKEGMSCYGIIIVRDENKVPQRIKEIHAKVINIKPESIKMEALEDVMINKIASCNKISMKKGECWEEVDGELFKTVEEAIRYIDTNYPGLRILY